MMMLTYKRPLIIIIDPWHKILQWLGNSKYVVSTYRSCDTANVHYQFHYQKPMQITIAIYWSYNQPKDTKFGV